MLRHVQLSRPFTPDGGHAFRAQVPEDFVEFARTSALGFVSEDGAALGTPDAIHQQIRDIGAGRFSIWGSDVYFSASDNTNCNDNGRTYALTAVDVSRPALIDRLAADDGFILQLINRAHERNNNFFLNFFGYYNVILAVLKRNKIALPKSAIEIGTGKTPYTALRFLIEGAERFVANDVLQVNRTFSTQFLRDMRVLMELVRRGSGDRLDGIVQRAGNGRDVGIKGLDVFDSQPFEEAQISGDFDLIFSTSVLEHVMKPREVVEKMYSLLKPGGHGWHCIDLRDHRDQSKPLAFLELTPEEYAAVNTENRLRASDWFQLFEDVGFELIDQEFSTLPSGCTNPRSSDYLHPPEPPVELWVDKAMRAKFKPPFDTKDLVDLSLLGVSLLYRKN